VLLIAALLLGVGFTSAPASSAADSSPAAADACRTVTLPVALVPGDTPAYSIWGQLCGAAPGRDVEVLTSGITYSYTYWDWPYQPGTYSYVRAANLQGHATFNYDRIGIGNSSHPAAASITIPAEAFVLHQIITALRAGRFGQSFGTVITVGHSLGSLMTMEEAGQYQDVNGVVLSGISHSFVTVGVALLLPDFVPTQLDPVLAPDNLPLGYVTTRAGTREEHFYYAPTAVPQVVALDEATKQAGTATELATIAVALPFSLQITAPVLVINGDEDQLVCGTLPCSSPLSQFNTEPLFYPRAASYQEKLIPEAGHDLNLQTNAPQFFAAVGAWIAQAVS
jgi:pimeloyl-ACP methyl ester carboxylesterase